MNERQAKSKINSALENGLAAVRLVRSNESQYSESYSRNLKLSAAATAIAGVFGLIAIITVRRAVHDYEKHRQWKRLDEQLDEALAESLDASDPVSLY